MAFNLKNLTPLAQGKNGVVPCLYTYWNEADDTLTTADFFPMSSGLRANDQLIIISNDFATFKTGYFTSDGEKLTLVERPGA